MNYKNIYDNLIKKAKSRPQITERREIHHIIPRSMGGNNEKTNLIDLTCKEHFIAHLLLAKIYGGKMFYAANMMSNFKKYNSRKYTWIREKYGKIHSKSISGQNHPQYGKVQSKEWIEKRLKNTDPNSQKSMLGKSGDKSPTYGRKATEEQRKQLAYGKIKENLESYKKVAKMILSQINLKQIEIETNVGMGIIYQIRSGKHSVWKFMEEIEITQFKNLPDKYPGLNKKPPGFNSGENNPNFGKHKVKN